MNQVTLIGRLGQNVELVTFEDGGKIGKFSLATNENYTSTNGEKVEHTEWHNIETRNKQGIS